MKKKFLHGMIPGLAIAVIIAGTFFIYGDSAQAQITTATGADAPRAVSAVKENVWQAIVKAARVSFINSLRSVVNQVAFETATYIGSGGTGQTPVYYTKKFGEWIREQGANAGGDFIEEFSKSNNVVSDLANKYNICSPDLSVSIKISLGLTNYAKDSAGLTESRCNLTDIWESGRDQVDQWGKAGYWKGLAENSFDPATTDIGAALTLFNEIDLDTRDLTNKKTLERTEGATGGAWIPPQSLISKRVSAPPGSSANKLAQAAQLQTDSFAFQTGDVFVDASYIFLNQLAISAFNKILDTLTASDGGGSAKYFDQGNAAGIGITELSRKNSSILQARFNERSDYDILGQMSSCTDENNPGPTNCVITQQFAQAINDHLTVAEAVERVILDPNKRIGFDQNGNDLSYTNGYPYRSLIILRKFRILPVGWEVAAQYIKDNPQSPTVKNITLGDLLACYEKDDQAFTQFYAPWCEGLIDPNWVLKVPKQYCGMEGYGPNILQQIVSPSSKGYCAKTAINCTKFAEGCETNNVTCTTDPDCAASGEYAKCNFTVKQDLQITRSNNYCADEQSCIKENTNGSCDFYGYCTEERRLWNFNTNNSNNSCEPRDNTCQTFTDGTNTASYLQNTLDYGNCNANQVGCQRYSTVAKAYANGKVSWSDTLGQRYFNKNVTPCEAGNEGCHEFIRVKDDLDTNLIADGSFELSSCVENLSDTGSETGGDTTQSRNSLIKTANAQITGLCQTQQINLPGQYLDAPNGRWYIAAESGAVRAGIVTAQASNGQKSLYVEGNGGLYSKDASAPSLLPAGFAMEANTYYTLSANVYIEAGSVRLGFGTLPGQFVNWNTTGSWKTIAVVLYNPSPATVHEFFLKGTGSGSKFYIDEIQLTKGRAASTYSEYGSANVIYQKLLPSYLEAICYTGTRGPNSGEYEFKADAPAECYKFARKCSANEVGCESYKAVDSGIAVTAKVKASDACPESCVGYNTYVQQANAFNPRQAAYFIPQTAKECSAQSVGCTAFTNLDKLDQGGEAIEYYTSMRTCRKPDASACGQYYTWEGSDDSGYQLQVYSLERNGTQPASTLSPAQEALLCNADVYKKLPSDPGYNYDCRQFYAADGSVSYHLYSKTISCSEDCHPYRREVASRSECENAGGKWDTENRCIYNVIPSEGTTCTAPEVGCQEYAGNIANNTREVFIPSPNTFENVSNPLEGWRSGSIVPSRSNESLSVGGHSLKSSKFEKTVGEDVSRNNSYTISFLARAQNAGTTLLQLSLKNKDNQTSSFNTSGSSFGTEWKLYTFNLEDLDHEVTERGRGTTGELLTLEFSGQVYLDNIRLTEIPDRYYLIKDSWITPDECDQDQNGAASARYMLGCSQYEKADRSFVTLRSFTGLCQDSAAGCEAMIDTRNSTNPAKTAVNDTNNNRSCDQGETDCVETPADTMINVVYDRTKLCASPQKGCQRVGAMTTYDGTTTFKPADSYLKNDPDQYSSIVCTAAGVSCGQFTTADGGTVYFKDPGEQVCEWRLKTGTVRNSGYGWYKKKVNRCGGLTTGALCSSAADCAANQACQLVTDDQACATPSASVMPKTLGTGGIGSRVILPTNWAASCEQTQSSCTEYIDPLSTANSNMVNNPTYAVTGTTRHDPWREAGATAEQNVSLQFNTLYIIKGDLTHGPTIPATAAWITSCQNALLYELNPSKNDFVEKTTSSQASGTNSVEFYLVPSSGPNAQTVASTGCTFVRGDKTTGQSVQLRKAIVSYQLGRNLDRTTPNGLASPNKGYIMFNERAQNGSSKKSLAYNADSTFYGTTNVYNSGSGIPPSTQGTLNSNVILKVQPDRTCSKWLACTTSVTDPNDASKQQCLDVGLCDALDNEGNCKHFIDAPKTNQIPTTPEADFANMTGYSKVGYKKLLEVGTGNDAVPVSSSLRSDFYNFATMRQEGQSFKVKGGDFETPSADWTGDITSVSHPGVLSSLGLSPYHKVLQGANQGGSFLPPVGRGLGRLKSGLSFDPPKAMTIATQPATALENGKKYVLSAYVYISSETPAGKDAGVRIKSTNPTTTQTLITTTTLPRNQWVRRSIGFTLPSEATDPVIEIYNSSSDVFYIDNITIETSLNYRCNKVSGEGELPIEQCQTLNPPSEANSPLYVAPSCRLFPGESSLSCEQSDDNGVTTKGVKGYCMEADPKNPDTCLMWYPIDRIQGGGNDDQIVSNLFDTDLYYCIEAAERCVSDGTAAAKPELYCKTFVKVDATKYWYNRVLPGSSFVMSNADGFFKDTAIFKPFSTETGNPYYNKMLINFGNKYPNHGILTIDALGTGRVFGALRTSDIPTTPSIVKADGASFIPLYFPPYSYNINGGWSGERLANNNRLVCKPDGNTVAVGVEAKSIGDVRRDDFDSAYVMAQDIVTEDGCLTCYINGSCSKGGCARENYHQIFNNYYYTAKITPLGHGDAKGYTDSTNDNERLFKIILNEDGPEDEDDRTRSWFSYGWNIKDFSVADSIIDGVKAIRRIFVSDDRGGNNWSVYQYNGTGYTPIEDGLAWLRNIYPTPTDLPSIKECPLVNGVRTRPSTYQSNNDDYCYILPKVSEFKIKNQPTLASVFSNERVAISFNTTTDSMQLPLDTVEFFTDESQLTTNSGDTLWTKVGDSNPRIANKSFQYWAIKSALPAGKCAEAGQNVRNTNITCGPNAACCAIKPALRITDNWRYYDTAVFEGYVIVNDAQ